MRPEGKDGKRGAGSRVVQSPTRFAVGMRALVRKDEPRKCSTENKGGRTGPNKVNVGREEGELAEGRGLVGHPWVVFELVANVWRAHIRLAADSGVIAWPPDEGEKVTEQPGCGPQNKKISREGRGGGDGTNPAHQKGARGAHHRTEAEAKAERRWLRGVVMDAPAAAAAGRRRRNAH